MRFLSVCSGIEAASCAWTSIGWEALAFSEIEPFPCAVLAHRYPNTPNLGDMTKFKEWPRAAIDLLVGGTPCQSFSVAGLRKGLADPRGNLMLTYLAIADKYRPRWLVWENVPGVLSSCGGRDFGTFLGGLAELGYGFAYRILDAQYFGVPQRRRRVFVVGHLGDWRRAAAVLFERHGLQGHPAPSREAGPVVAALTANGVGTCGADDNQGQAGHLIASTGDVSHCLNAGGMGWQDYETETLIAHSLRGEGFDASEDGTGRGTPLVSVQPFTLAVRGRGESHDLEYRQDGTANALLTPNGGRAGIGCGAIAFMQNQRDEVRTSEVIGALQAEPGMKQQIDGENGQAVAVGFNWQNAGGYGNANEGLGITMDGTGPLQRCQTPAVAAAMQVRRLTPRECERLQGFPDDYTQIPWRGNPPEQCPDGPRYKALGNSMAVPVMRWIGERIQMVEQLAIKAAA